jgi:hypothetical protein
VTWTSEDFEVMRMTDWRMDANGRFERRKYSANSTPEEILASITEKAAAGDAFHQRALVESMRRRMTK